ncbi:MAG: hypothetical protein ACQERS_01255 [Bacteroidota bacterium]
MEGNNPIYRYTDLYKKGILQERASEMSEKLSSCTLCPRNCDVNRLENEKGICNTGRKAMVSSYSAHFGEEKPLMYKQVGDLKLNDEGIATRDLLIRH